MGPGVQIQMRPRLVFDENLGGTGRRVASVTPAARGSTVSHMDDDTVSWQLVKLGKLGKLVG